MWEDVLTAHSHQSIYVVSNEHVRGTPCHRRGSVLRGKNSLEAETWVLKMQERGHIKLLNVGHEQIQSKKLCSLEALLHGHNTNEGPQSVRNDNFLVAILLQCVSSHVEISNKKVGADKNVDAGCLGHLVDNLSAIPKSSNFSK